MPPLPKGGYDSVHSAKFPPMAGGSDGQEVVCIEAKRVCDFCFHKQRTSLHIGRTLPAPGP